MNFLKTLLLSLLVVLAPIKAALSASLVLIFLDYLTGMWAAHKRGEAITSAGMRRTVSKICIYQLVLISSFLVEIYMIDKILPMSKLSATAIGLVEIKSILENSNSILGVDIFKSLINKIGSMNDE